MTPLSELPSSNIMAPISDAIAAEVKGLKAAYRTAIGARRKGAKRTKGQKNDSQLHLDAENHAGELADAPGAVEHISRTNVAQLHGRDQHGKFFHRHSRIT